MSEEWDEWDGRLTSPYGERMYRVVRAMHLIEIVLFAGLLVGFSWHAWTGQRWTAGTVVLAGLVALLTYLHWQAGPGWRTEAYALISVLVVIVVAGAADYDLPVFHIVVCIAAAGQAVLMVRFMAKHRAEIVDSYTRQRGR